MSSSFWTMVGRVCCQKEFCEAVMQRGVSGAKELNEVSALYYLLVDPSDARANRFPGLEQSKNPDPFISFRTNYYEIMELNAVMVGNTDRTDGDGNPILVGSTGGPIDQLYEAIMSAWDPRDGEEIMNPSVWELIGLCCCDRNFLDRFLRAAQTPGAFDTNLAKKPSFIFDSGAATRFKDALRVVLADNDVSTKILAATFEMGQHGWRLINGVEVNVCSAGLESGAEYIHYRLADLRAARGEVTAAFNEVRVHSLAAERLLSSGDLAELVAKPKELEKVDALLTKVKDFQPPKMSL